MFEEEILVGDIKNLYKGKTPPEVRREIKNACWGVNIIAINPIASFENSEVIHTTAGTLFDLPELWTIGKASFESLSMSYEKKIETKEEIELLSIFYTNFIYVAIESSCRSGQAHLSNGTPLNISEIPQLHFDQVLPAPSHPDWEYYDNFLKSLFEASANCHLLQAIDTAIITHIEKDANALSAAMESVYLYKHRLDLMQAVDSVRRRQVSKAAKARHSETEDIKNYLFDIYDKNRDRYKSLRSAALDLEKYAPVKHRTIYDWLRKRERDN